MSCSYLLFFQYDTVTVRDLNRLKVFQRCQLLIKVFDVQKQTRKLHQLSANISIMYHLGDVQNISQTIHGVNSVSCK